MTLAVMLRNVSVSEVINNGVSMKISQLVPITLAIVLVSAPTQSKIMYGDIQVTNIAPTVDFVWQRANQNTPRYPVELARSGLRGCAVLSFNITDSGKAEDIEIVHSLPKSNLGRSSKKMLRKWKWVPVLSESNATAEKRTLRLDFCMGGESIEQAQEMCKQQAKLACR